MVDEMDKARSDRLEVKFVQKELNLGIALPKGEPKLKAWLDDWIRAHFADGSLHATFRKFQNRGLPADLVDRQ